MEGRNSANTKLHNRRRILRLIRQGAVSRAALSRHLGLTRAAISMIVDELIAEGMVREADSAQTNSGPGRNPVALTLCPGACYAVGVGLSRFGCEVGVQDLTGEVLCWQELDMDGKSWREMADRIAETVRRQIRAIDKERLLGVGIACPGPVDSMQGRILNPPGFDCWQNVPIAEYLEGVLQLPVYLENDANACALYNYIANDFPNKEDFALLYVDQGVGSGVISGGKLLRSCELGHTSIDFRGPVCSCGNRGCLELYASTVRIAGQYGMQSWEALMASAHASDAIEQEAEALAAGIVNLCNLVRPEAVLLGGHLQAYAGRLLPRIQELVKGRTLCSAPVTLLPALYDRENKVKSACSVVFGRFLAVL